MRDRTYLYRPTYYQFYVHPSKHLFVWLALCWNSLELSNLVLQSRASQTTFLLFFFFIIYLMRFSSHHIHSPSISFKPYSRQGIFERFKIASIDISTIYLIYCIINPLMHNALSICLFSHAQYLPIIFKLFIFNIFRKII